MTEFQAYKNTNFYVPIRYKIQEILGRGSYGVVCVAIDTKSSDPVKLAVKKICKILQREILLRRAIRELKLMRFFRSHRNVCIEYFTWHYDTGEIAYKHQTYRIWGLTKVK